MQALSNGRIQGQDTYVLALPKTDVSAEDETVAFPSLALPSDIQDIQVVAQVEQDAAGEKVPILQLTIKRVTPFIGYIMLLSAIWGVASLGAGFKMLEPAHPMLKAYWRSCVSVIILSPWTAMSVISNPRCTHSLRDSRICLQLLLTAMGSAGFVGFFVFSLSHCGMETAFLLSNCHSLLIVSWRLISGSPVSLIEGAGVLLGLLGAGIASMDSGTQGPQKGVDTALHLFTALIDAVLVAGNGAQMWSAKALDPDTAGQLFGAVLAFLSGVCGAIYITSAAKVMRRAPPRTQ